MQTPSPAVSQPLLRFSGGQRSLVAWLFLLCACIPWLNPVAGGAMTPAIPLITGWFCIAILLLLECCRRVVGLPIVVIASVFILVSYFGRAMPGF